MKMPPAKRNQLIGVVLGTGAMICLVYFLLIQPQKLKNENLGRNIVKETKRLQE